MRIFGRNGLIPKVLSLFNHHDKEGDVWRTTIMWNQVSTEHDEKMNIRRNISYILSYTISKYLGNVTRTLNNSYNFFWGSLFALHCDYLISKRNHKDQDVELSVTCYSLYCLVFISYVGMKCRIFECSTKRGVCGTPGNILGGEFATIVNNF